MGIYLVFASRFKGGVQISQGPPLLARGGGFVLCYLFPFLGRTLSSRTFGKLDSKKTPPDCILSGAPQFSSQFVDGLLPLNGLRALTKGRSLPHFPFLPQDPQTATVALLHSVAGSPLRSSGLVHFTLRSFFCYFEWLLSLEFGLFPPPDGLFFSPPTTQKKVDPVFFFPPHRLGEGGSLFRHGLLLPDLFPNVKRTLEVFSPQVFPSP